MIRYIGLDVHAQTTAIGVLSESGRRLDQRIVRTAAPELIEFVRLVPKPRKLILEEGTQSEWLSQVLEPFVDELVVTVPERKPHRTKNDIEDAFARAEELRRNAVDKRVFKARPEAGQLRTAMKLFEVMNRDVVRAKNQFRALLMGRGISERVSYDPTVEQLAQLMKRLPASMRFAAEAGLEKVAALEELRSRAWDALLHEAQKHRDFRRLMTVPGIGELRAAILLAVVVDPNRFRQREQFWSYCGLGVRTEASGEWRVEARKVRRQREPMTRGLQRGNGQLKGVFCGAALSVSRMDHPLGHHYRALVTRGLKENLARITLARKLAAITLALWKSKEEYDARKHRVLS